jgi:hypothetical protein
MGAAIVLSSISSWCPSFHHHWGRSNHLQGSHRGLPPLADLNNGLTSIHCRCRRFSRHLNGNRCRYLLSISSTGLPHTVNPALLTSSFVWQMQLSLLHISLFKIIKRKYFSQRKCELLIFLFVLLDKIKILPLETAYFASPTSVYALPNSIEKFLSYIWTNS